MNSTPPHAHTRHSRRRLRRAVLIGLCGVAVTYVFVAYLLVPAGWSVYSRRHPSFADDPRVTLTHDGHPGDPLNVALIGTEEEVTRGLRLAGWLPADPLGLVNDLEIAADAVFSRPDVEAPVSNLWLYGRTQDLAFEKPVGNSPRQRHHVRFWKTASATAEGRPMWLGAASFDVRAGFSHTTGQITHHIAPDVDAERDHLLSDLRQAGGLLEVYSVDRFHTILEGRNGGGDAWRTNGALSVGVLAPRPAGHGDQLPTQGR